MGSNGNDVELDLVVQMRIPAFGYSLTEFTVIELPKLGQSLSTGECACVLESDKAIHEVAAPCSGTVSEHHASLGQILPVGSLLVSIDGKGVASPNSVTTSKACEVGSEIAGRAMIPSSPDELYSDLKHGYSLYKQAKQAQKTGAVKTKGYSWDDAITPTLYLSAEDCPDGYCPTPPSEDRRPLDRVAVNPKRRSLFEAKKNR